MLKIHLNQMASNEKDEYELDPSEKYVINMDEELEFQTAIMMAIEVMGSPPALKNYHAWLFKNHFNSDSPNPTNDFVAPYYGAKPFLKNITDKIEKYSYLYRELYTKSYDEIEKYSSDSLESRLMGGASIVSKGMGRAIEKVPVVSRTQLDENLQKAGRALKEKKKTDTARMISVMVDQQSSQTKPFVDNINMVSRLYNEPLEIIFDDENVYLPVV